MMRTSVSVDVSFNCVCSHSYSPIFLILTSGVWANSDDEAEERQGFGSAGRRSQGDLNFISTDITGGEQVTRLSSDIVNIVNSFSALL